MTQVTEEAVVGAHTQGMKQAVDVTLGEAAAQSPASARVFAAHRIDFCCAGQVSITEACLARGLDPADILQELESAAGSTEADSVDWQSAPIGDLIDHIVRQHHAYLKAQLPVIQELFEDVLHRHSREHGDVLRALSASFRRMKESLAARLMQQETVIFPLLRQFDGPGFSGPHRLPEHNAVHRMMEGHDSTAEALSEIRRLTSNYQPPAGASASYQQLYGTLQELDLDLRRHFHLENNILFRRAALAVQ